MHNRDGRAKDGLSEARSAARRKENRVTVLKREMGEYVNPTRDEMLADNADRLKRRKKLQEQQESGGRPKRSSDQPPERVRRSGYVAASRRDSGQ